MSNGLKTILSLLLISLLSAGAVNAQTDTTQAAVPAQTLPYNAGFDVIIKMNGEIVYGLVKEVGLDYITYKRTDIPDGPVYTITRNEVYAISYRNQVKEYINPVYPDQQPVPLINNNVPYPGIDYKRGNLFANGTATIGIGFLRSFTKVQNVKDYSSSSSFPVLSFGYDVYFKNNVSLGVLLGFGSHNFSNQKYSSYDSTENNVSLKENIFALYVYGKYRMIKNTSRLQPYVMAGLGITSSHIVSENTINFTNDNTETILVKSGTHATGLGIIARIGAEYYINNQLQAFADVGVGLSVINLGISVKVK